MFSETQIRKRARGTQGVVGIKLSDSVNIISSLLIQNNLFL